MSPLSLHGVWKHSAGASSEYDEFMCVDELRGRIVVFVVVDLPPVKRVPMRLWYRPESATSIAATLRPNGPWQITAFHRDGDFTTWTYGGSDHTWHRIADSEYPGWLVAAVATAHAKMDEAEKCAS
jgi:hypothetical protein